MKQMTKRIKEKKEYFIDFNDDECKEFGILENQKYTTTIEKDGTIKMVPFATIDIDLAEFSRNTLEFLVAESVEKDISVNDVISNVLEKTLKNYE